jgi:hypothetical protein
MGATAARREEVGADDVMCLKANEVEFGFATNRGAEFQSKRREQE